MKSTGGLLYALQQADASINMYNVESTKAFTKPEDLPTDVTKFTQYFHVQPYLGRNGAGRIHIHFNLPDKITIETLKQNKNFLHYLQTNKIWLTTHHFKDSNIALAGFIFMKSPTLTHNTEYVKALRTFLLRQDFSKRTAQAPMDSSDDEAPSPLRQVQNFRIGTLTKTSRI